MIEYKFMVCMEDVDGIPGLTLGNAVIPVANECLPGGYEYRVWHRLDTGTTAKTRIEHLGSMRSFTVEGEDMDEVRAKVAEICAKVIDGRIEASL